MLITCTLLCIIWLSYGGEILNGLHSSPVGACVMYGVPVCRGRQTAKCFHNVHLKVWSFASTVSRFCSTYRNVWHSKTLISSCIVLNNQLVTVDEYNGSKKKPFHLQVKVHLGTCCNTFLKSLIFFFFFRRGISMRAWTGCLCNGNSTCLCFSGLPDKLQSLYGLRGVGRERA